MYEYNHINQTFQLQKFIYMLVMSYCVPHIESNSNLNRHGPPHS